MKYLDEMTLLQDRKYRDFQAKLIPNIDKKALIGVRTPDLRKLAKKMIKEDYQTFTKKLPHQYFDENQLHAFLISEIKDYEECIKEINYFLPYVDNWATCDQMSPTIFKKHKKELLEEIKQWLQSNETYTVRFGIGMLMHHYLDNDFKPEYLKWVCGISSKEYYVNMMKAWYFATALAKQYEHAIIYFEKNKLDSWTHNKAIQKGLESYRISQFQKDYLKTLKRKNRKSI